MAATDVGSTAWIDSGLAVSQLQLTTFRPEADDLIQHFERDASGFNTTNPPADQ
jgi:hypothetical protein